MMTVRQMLDAHRRIVIISAVICLSVLMIVLVLACIPSVLQIVSGGAYYSTNELPVNQSAAFDPPQTANLSQSQSPGDARFTVTVENQTQYTVSRQDAVGNPSHVLRPADARVVGATLVIREESVTNNSDPDTLSPSVVSTGSYTEQWDITVPIEHVAVYHPYQDHPYVKPVDSN